MTATRLATTASAGRGLALGQVAGARFPRAVASGGCARTSRISCRNDRITALAQRRQALGSVLAAQLAAFARRAPARACPARRSRLRPRAADRGGIPAGTRQRGAAGWSPAGSCCSRAWRWRRMRRWYPVVGFRRQDSWLRGRLAGLRRPHSLRSLFAALPARWHRCVRGAPRLAGRAWRSASPGAARFARGRASLLPLATAAASSPRRSRAPSPHIVVILGVDSLRNDLDESRAAARRRRRTSDAFLAGARRFSDATTPLARTYASWVSILTGRHPGHDQCALQPDAARAGARGRHAGRRAARPRLSRDLCDRRSALRELRPSPSASTS